MKVLETHWQYSVYKTFEPARGGPSLVRVRVIESALIPNFFAVEVAWGKNASVSKAGPTGSLEAAIDIFLQLCAMPIVDRVELVHRGFC